METRARSSRVVKVVARTMKLIPNFARSTPTSSVRLIGFAKITLATARNIPRALRTPRRLNLRFFLASGIPKNSSPSAKNRSPSDLPTNNTKHDFQTLTAARVESALNSILLGNLKHLTVFLLSLVMMASQNSSSPSMYPFREGVCSLLMLLGLYFPQPNEN